MPHPKIISRNGD
ncbi:hypothetical protein S40288_11587 [Stachybotrys chartarum IBT 40288]|nr:hypothetical protein S40288_11587 [Stachybotrys chartarum IBT 40288]